MPKCHTCGKELKGLKCSCGEEYVKKDGRLFRKNIFGRSQESLGKNNFKPKVNKKYLKKIL